MLAPAESDTRFLTNLMDDLSMQLVPTGSSHHTDNNDTWIDTIFVDSCDNIINSESFLIPNFPNRHDVISVTISIFYHEPLAIPITYKPINKISPKDLNAHLLKLNWTEFTKTYDNFDIDQGLSDLTSNLQNVIDTLAPEKAIVPRKAKPLGKY